jgi:integrase-like protein
MGRPQLQNRPVRNDDGPESPSSGVGAVCWLSISCGKVTPAQPLRSTTSSVAVTDAVARLAQSGGVRGRSHALHLRGCARRNRHARGHGSAYALMGRRGPSQRFYPGAQRPRRAQDEVWQVALGFPMTPRLIEALREHAARYRLVTYMGARSPWLFQHTRTARTCKAGQRIKSLRHAFRDAVAAAGLPTARQHDLRHRRVTTWLAEGRNPVHVKEAVGHSALATTMGYTHLAREHLKALVTPNEQSSNKASGVVGVGDWDG